MSTGDAAPARKRVGVSGLPRLLTAALRLTWQASPRGFVTAAVLQLVGSLSTIALVVVGKSAIDAIVGAGQGAGRVGQLVPVVILLAIVTALGSSASSLQRQQQRLLGEQVGDAAWRRLLDVTGRVELEHYESPAFYDHLQRVETNSMIVPATVTNALFGLAGGVTTAVGLLIAVLTIEPLLVPLLLLVGIPTLLLARRSSRREFAFAVSISPLFRARQYLRTVLTGRDEAKEVRAFGAERTLRGRHDERSADLLERLRRNVRDRQLYAIAGVATTAIALSLSLGLLVWFLAVGRLTVAEAGAAILAVRLLSTSLDQVFLAVAGLFEAGVFLDDLEAFLALTPPAREPVGDSRPTLHEALEVDAVSYRYEGSDELVLRDVSLRIGAGEVVAIVGENGSGKTTLAKLLAGLYAPTTGRIAWDGTATADLERAEVRRSVAVIFQDFVRYQLTAQENIGLGEPDRVADQDAARDAARRAGAAGFLERLPLEYDTILSKEYENGTELSLGQWQRVALARALRRDAPLMILDEPSSALDPRAEQELFTDIRAMLGGRSAVLISHRYSTVRSVDRIYVLRDGRVAEVGSHRELMDLGGLYAELFTMQAGAYT